MPTKTQNPPEEVPCKWCGKPTPMIGTRLCDPCWELDRRITKAPEIARRILAEIDRAP